VSPGDDLEAVVLAYGPRAYLAVVHGLIAQGLQAAAITVVQNPRVPGEPPLPAHPEGIRILPMAVNGGYGPAMNAALAAPRRPSSRWVLLLTHDVQFAPGALNALARAADGAEGIGLLAPVLRWVGEDAVYDRTYGGVWDARGRVDHITAPGPELRAGITACDWADGSVLLLRREALASTGPIDERFFLYFEETELCLRLRRAGWAAGCVLDAECTQEAGVQRRPGAYAYLFTRNAVEFARRAGGSAAALRTAVGAVSRLPLRRLVRPSSTAQVRRTAAQSTIGALAGLVAFALRRFGPPPRWLPGMGDVRV